MVTMHPFLKISLFILTLVLTGQASADQLSLMLGVLLLLIVYMKHQSYLQVLLRMRWLFVSILLIYAFGTPGELVSQFPIQFAPSYEGLALGLVQLARLLIALASLNLLLTASPKEEMMLGLYCLLLPFKYLGLNVKRFTARLMLTLHYVEELAESGRQGLNFEALDNVHKFEPELEKCTVYIQQRSFSLLDQLMLIVMAVLLTITIYWNMP